jgi:spore coat protein U-like protein
MMRFAARGRAIAAAVVVLAALVLLQHGLIAEASSHCSVTTTAIPFNVFSPLSTSSDTFSGTVLWSCTGSGSTSVSITLSAGNSGSSSSRYMTSTTSTDKLFYNLYTDIGHTNIWNDTTNYPSNIPIAASGSVPIYGQIPAALVGGQNDVSSGTYTDSINAIINY